MLAEERVSDEAVELLTQLIRIPTVSGVGRETEAAHFLAARAEACGLTARVSHLIWL